MSIYRPKLDNPVPMKLLKPTYKTELGVRKKTFPEIKDGLLFYGTFKSYGGTERENNGVYMIEDTASIECVYRPDITSDCRIVLMQNSAVYDIINEPENVNMRNKYLIFKVKRIIGGA